MTILCVDGGVTDVFGVPGDYAFPTEIAVQTPAARLSPIETPPLRALSNWGGSRLQLPLRLRRLPVREAAILAKA
jgi:hypothetical protein